MTLRALPALCLILGFAAFPARAATLQVDSGGVLTGASGVEVNGAFYDVSFTSGTCIEAFDGCDNASKFDFTDEVSASAAAQALLDQVFIDGPAGDFDTSQSFSGAVFYGFDSFGGVLGVLAANTYFSDDLSTLIASTNSAFGHFGAPQTSFSVGDILIAKFTAAEMPEVPLSGALIFMLSGLAGLRLTSRKARRGRDG